MLAVIEFDLAVIPLDAAYKPHQSVIFADKLCDKCIFRPFIQVAGRCQLLDDAIIEDGDTVRHSQRLGLVVGYVDDCYTEAFMNMFNFVLHLLTQLFVKRTQWFVHQHKVRIKYQSPGNGYPLLLTTRELGRTTIAKRAELYHVECALGS